MKEQKKRRHYEKPKIVYEKKIETLAVVCNTAWLHGVGCMKSSPSCSKLAG